MMILNILARPETAGLVTIFASVVILRYLQVFGRETRDHAWVWVLLFSLCNGIAFGFALSNTADFVQRMPLLLLIFSTAISLENDWISDTSVGASLMLGSSVLQNYLSLYFIICAIFRLLPSDNYFLTTELYRIFAFSVCNIVCAMAVFILYRYFPNQELKISLYSKSYSPLLRVWLPISNILTVMCTMIAMPLIPLRDISRPLELAFFVTLLGWMLSNLSASYLIALIQSWRVRHNERANNASMTIRAMRQEFMLTYLVNISTDEFMIGRDLFHVDGHHYSAMRKLFVEECVHPEDAEAFFKEFSRPNYYETRLLTSPCYDMELRCNKRKLMDLVNLPEDAVQKFSQIQGDYVWINAQCVLTQSVWGEILLNVGFKDIDQEKRTQLKLHKAATTQPLTGLLNRREWKIQVHKRLDNGCTGILAIIDLDHFKDVNDNLGHQAGDEILKETAKILTGTFRAAELVGHIGGDEFCVFAEKITDLDVLHNKMESLLEQRRKSYVGKDGKRKSLSFSIGVVMVPEDSGSLDDIIYHADMALYQAKEDGRDCYRVFSS